MPLDDAGDTAHDELKQTAMQAAVLARSPIARAAVARSVRYLATKPPPPKGPPRNPPPSPAESAKAPPPPPVTSLPSLDFAPSEENVRQERTGARSSKNSLSSIEQQRRLLARGLMVAALIGAGVQAWYAGREWDEEELKAKKMVCAIVILSCFLR